MEFSRAAKIFMQTVALEMLQQCAGALTQSNRQRTNFRELITAHGHFLSENGVFYIVQFKPCYFSPRRWRRVGLHCFVVSRSMVVVIAT